MLKFFTKSNTLKLALFATGLSGIVAEYILSTLATYFLGNSVLQWTLILSSMLFAMGLGSRISKHLEHHLLEKFIVIEFTLSILVSFSSMVAYGAAAYASFNDSLAIFSIPFEGVLIYSVSIIIGLLIGLEIPLVTRLNEEFETLRVNISAVMEQDYFGSLLGGLFFAFVGLPYLGLTYTPFVLGGVNFLVAILLFFRLKDIVSPRYSIRLKGAGVFVFALIVIGGVFAKSLINYGEQKRYKDKVVLQKQTAYQRLVVTQWKDFHWFYINGNQQLSSFDEWMYHEPMAHSVMKLHKNPQNILILGGGDGCLAREILKYPSVKSITLVDLDPVVTELGKTHSIFTDMNKNSLNDPRVKIINTDAFNYMEDTNEFFDVMMVDFPDPKSIELGRLFSFEMYKQCYKHLRPNGVMIIQAGSPYYATKAFMCIDKTLSAAGFNTIKLHNQVLTLGEWGWVLGAKSIPKEDLKPALQNMTFEDIPTRWLDHDAMSLITSFGKPLIEVDSTEIEVNTIHNPVLPRYYRKGNWDLY
ncbi:polyamine aminopropyltransferase [Limibacter armeniacum]|uniref:polyamine aminopropyltransferase n=1 Tax=Limibacter armeniacum TaxID=466084 RepID=UPI002FE525D1